MQNSFEPPPSRADRCARTASLLGVVLALAAAPSPAAGATAPHPPAGAAGYWEGVVHRGASRLAVRMEFTSTGATAAGSFSAPDVGATDIPLRHVRLSPRVHADLVGDDVATAIDAKVTGDVMTGSFDEAGARAGTLELHRIPASRAKPYDTQPVTFANGTIGLAGTLYVPHTKGAHPAAVLVQGSGPEGRWATAWIADALARAGVVALSYDKRGVGASHGDWRTATFDDLAADARAAVHLLAQRTDVDRSRVGVYGHSQGGALAPAIAAHDPDVRWIAAADGPVGPTYRQDVFRVDNALARTYSGEQLADAERVYAEFVDVARTGAPHDTLRADIARAGTAPWIAALAIPPDDSWIWPWYAKTGNYDNTQAWKSVRVPVLVLFGANDALVPVHESIDETTRLLHEHGNEHVTVKIFPGADHTLRIPPANRDGWPHRAPGFPDILAKFANHPA